MKKIGIGIFLLLLFLLLFTQSVSANDKSSEELYQELLQNYRRYQGLVEPFNVQRSRHLTFQTVATQADFLNASKTLLSAEIESILSYTSFIRTYLAEATRILNYRENYLYVMLDDELAYLSSAKEKVTSLSSLSETQSFMTQLQSHSKAVNQISYQVKSLVEIGSAEKTLENIEVETEKIENLLGEIKSEEAKIYAAKEKFSSLKKELQSAEDVIKQADNKLKNSPKDANFKEVSRSVREQIDQSLNKFSSIVSGYKNIVYSLRQNHD